MVSLIHMTRYSMTTENYKMKNNFFIYLLYTAFYITGGNFRGKAGLIPTS